MIKIRFRKESLKKISKLQNVINLVQKFNALSNSFINFITTTITRKREKFKKISINN